MQVNGTYLYLWRHSPAASWVVIHGIYSISKSSQPGATVLGQVHGKWRPQFISLLSDIYQLVGQSYDSLIHD